MKVITLVELTSVTNPPVVIHRGTILDVQEIDGEQWIVSGPYHGLQVDPQDVELSNPKENNDD